MVKFVSKMLVLSRCFLYSVGDTTVIEKVLLKLQLVTDI